MLRFCAVFTLFLLFTFSSKNILACGYNFVGDCSTSISLKINGTQDSFAVASCPNLLKFDGFSLGSLQSLSIARAKATTWESCHNNVSGMELWYRVYQEGFPGGNWQTLSLQEDYNTVVGPYTTRYRSVNTNTSLTAGLTVGNTYVLEIYFRAQVDTIGDDFIPETTLLQDNNGQNYHFTFQYGGASAPPFLVIPTRIIPVKCYGGNNGVAGVTVYGNQSGLFYQWSTGGNNFWILGNLSAGTYSVTVTGAGGYSASDTIEIIQPQPITADFTVVGLGCNGSPGQARASASGGSAPYYYYWQNGLTDSVATFPASGEYAMTVTDLKGCSADFSVGIPDEPIVMVSETEMVCEGAVFTIGGVELTAPGTYEISALGANGDCDTLKQLTLHVLAHPSLDMQFKAVAPFACSETDSTHLLLETATNAESPVYTWFFDGEIISTTDTCAFVFPGTGLLPVVQVTDAHGCTAQAGGIEVAVPQPLPLLVSASVSNPANGLDNGLITLYPADGTAPYRVLWSQGDTTFVIDQLANGTYCATVTDAHGCTTAICETLQSSGVSDPASVWSVRLAPNPVQAGYSVLITGSEIIKDGEVRLEILNLQGQALLRQPVWFNHGLTSLQLPETLRAGVFILHLTAREGFNATCRLTVF